MKATTTTVTIMAEKQKPELKRKQIHTWRDWFVGLYFSSMVLGSITTIGSSRRLYAYGIASIIIGLIGTLAVIYKLKRVESIMLITLGFLLMVRAMILIPPQLAQDNTTLFSYLVDIAQNRPLIDGLSAIFPLTVLAAYRERRGRISR